jgi:RsiW-degrading membrane proteinase PrsW (M82 family)
MVAPAVRRPSAPNKMLHLIVAVVARIHHTLPESPLSSVSPLAQPPPPPPDPSFADSRPLRQPGSHSRTGFWWALALELVGLALFVLLFTFVLPSLGQNLNQPARIGLGLLMALIPAALWLSFFLALDRNEPEPKWLVVRTLAASAILFVALAGPLLNGLFAIDEWLYTGVWSRLLGGFLVVGVIEQAIVYLAVRLTIFGRPEFSERVDGVIYGVAAGLGVATVVNFAYVLERGGVDLDVGAVRMVINTLAYGAIAGVLGYFVGQARFERVPIWYLPAGLTAAALLNGLLFFLLDGSGTGLNPGSPWLDLGLAAAVAVLALAAVFGLVARAQAEPMRLEPAPAPVPRTQPRTAGRPLPAPLPVAAAHDKPEVVAEVDPSVDHAADGLPLPPASDVDDRPISCSGKAQG